MGYGRIIARLKWQFVGHFPRIIDDRWVQKAFAWRHGSGEWVSVGTEQDGDLVKVADTQETQDQCDNFGCYDDDVDKSHSACVAYLAFLLGLNRV